MTISALASLDDDALAGELASWVAIESPSADAAAVNRMAEGSLGAVGRLIGRVAGRQDAPGVHAGRAGSDRRRAA